MKKLLLLIVCGLALLGCDGFMELQTGLSETAVLDISEIELSEDSPLIDKGDHYLLGGDMIINKDDPLTAGLIAELSGDPRFSAARGMRDLKGEGYGQPWPNGKVPYYFATGFIKADGIRIGSSWDESEKEYIRKQMDILESHCGVEFVEAYPETHFDSLYSTTDKRRLRTYALFKDESVSYCYSTLGYQSRPFASITKFSGSSAMHELIHGLGFAHEHQRPDRDLYVRFNITALESYQKTKLGIPRYDEIEYNAFKEYTGPVKIYTPYDYLSIMHYKSDAFAKTSMKTLTRLNGSTTLGGDVLTEGDITTLRAVYGIPENERVFIGNFFTTTKYKSMGEILILNNTRISLLDNSGETIFTHIDNEKILSYDQNPHETWRFRLKTDTFYQGDLDGDIDNEADLIVVSDWGIGLLSSYANHRFATQVIASNGSWFEGWKLDTSTDKIVAIEDFDGDGADEILIRSPWGMGILKYDTASRTFYDLGTYRNDRYIGGWKLEDNNTFIRFGNFDGKKGTDILVESPWGLGILAINEGSDRLTSLMVKPFGTKFDNWNYYKGQRFPAAGNFDGDIGSEEILVYSDWGIGVLKYENGTLRKLFAKSHGESAFDGRPFDVDYINNDSGTYRHTIAGVADFDNDGKDEILAYYIDREKKVHDYLYDYNGRFYERSLNLERFFSHGETLSQPTSFNYGSDIDFMVYNKDKSIQIIEYSGGQFNEIQSIYKSY